LNSSFHIYFKTLLIFVGYSSEKAAPVAIQCVRNWLEKDDISKNVSLLKNHTDKYILL
jgi:hypothetical protein